MTTIGEVWARVSPLSGGAQVALALYVALLVWGAVLVLRSLVHLLWRPRRGGSDLARIEDAAYREYRGARLTATDGRDLGRLVGRSARRRAEQDGGPHAA